MTRKKQDMQLWNALRYLFWIFIFVTAVYIISVFFDSDTALTITGIFFVLSILTALGTFIISIIHLTKYAEKAFAIVTLSISALLGLYMFISMTFLFSGESVSDFETYVDYTCSDLCYDVDYANNYDYLYVEATDEVMCYCYSETGELLYSDVIA